MGMRNAYEALYTSSLHGARDEDEQILYRDYNMK
jgi:hypothetical protein